MRLHPPRFPRAIQSPGRSRNGALRALVGAVALLLASEPVARALPIEITVFGDINAGQDHYCSLGLGPQLGCVPGFGMGADLAGTGSKIELTFTYDSDAAPPDNDPRVEFAGHFGDFDWIDLTIRLFDADSSITLVESVEVAEPDRQSGQINLGIQASGSSIFIDSRSIDDLSATDSSDAQIRGDFSLLAPGLLAAATLDQVFDWNGATDAGSGSGSFIVEKCETATPGCAYLGTGSFIVTGATATVVPEPGTATLVATGLALLSIYRGSRRRVPPSVDSP